MSIVKRIVINLRRTRLSDDNHSTSFANNNASFVCVSRTNNPKSSSSLLFTKRESGNCVANYIMTRERDDRVLIDRLWRTRDSMSEHATLARRPRPQNYPKCSIIDVFSRCPVQRETFLPSPVSSVRCRRLD